jgi:hypothetical protein
MIQQQPIVEHYFWYSTDEVAAISTIAVVEMLYKLEVLKLKHFNWSVNRPEDITLSIEY